jgi:hypothetical protein
LRRGRGGAYVMARHQIKQKRHRQRQQHSEEASVDSGGRTEPVDAGARGARAGEATARTRHGLLRRPETARCCVGAGAAAASSFCGRGRGRGARKRGQ